ncbi:hypothetical protein ASG73_01785 [Janibacter sp. Soil728]|uniref:hypothetical protein n=1 Tax=Janibacter sp. Soil728 TaxID=1736393 RepID=UPI00071311DC|nr:hypothetical protein [Janibacter sp. Soil728]KRE39108.1 hypothetical protein ASG73_01785 [Janibacter sp. Soil728]
MTMRTRVVALGAATALALTGCSMLGADDSDGDAGADASSSQTSGVVNGDASTNGAKAAGIDLKNPPKPIAEQTITVDQDSVDETKVELLELRRDDNVMLATFRLTGTGRGTEDKTAFKLLGWSSFAPVLIDMKNLEKYKHVEDLTSDDISASAPLGQPVYMFTAFPLPRDGVTEMDLRVTSESPAIEDIPMPK